MMDLPDKVKAALKKIPPFQKVVVGVSGGMDSVVLTHTLKHLGYEVIIAHLNHDLRGQASEKDEKFVIELAKAWELPFVSNKAVIPKKGNLEHNARNIRYSFLEEVRMSYKADYIAVGHHFDDQIETILMHEKRGSGLRGKRGMKLIKGHLIRPMLDIPQREIVDYAQKHLLDFVIDESNLDMSFERNHLRHMVIPELKKDPQFEKRIRESSQEARNKVDSLQIPKKEWWDQNFEKKSFYRGEFNALEEDLKAEILLDLVGQEDVYCTTIQRLMSFIEKGKTGKELMVKGVVFVIEYERVKFSLKKEVEDQFIPQEVKEKINWGAYEITVKNRQTLKVRAWKNGDKFQPSGMQGTKKLQDFFVDEKIPRQERKKIPLIVDENDSIICVGDLRFSEKFKEFKDEIVVKRKKVF